LAWLKHAQGNSKEAEALYRELIEYYKKEFQALIAHQLARI
jgi:hypothetical protein